MDFTVTIKYSVLSTNNKDKMAKKELLLRHWLLIKHVLSDLNQFLPTVYLA